MMFLILVWLIAAGSVVIYLVSWPTPKPLNIRVAFDVPVFLVLLLVYIVVRPGIPSNQMEAAEVAHWYPYLYSIYIAAISVLLLTAAGAVRYLIFRPSE